MKLKRAHSILNIRSVSEEGEERVIEGIATTAQVDSYGDIVEPMGAEFDLPMPLLWQHEHDKPVGHVEFAKPTRDGVPFRARIFSINEPGKLKDRLDEAWQSVKLGLVKAVSIGFRPIEWTTLKEGGYRFEKWKWVELSLVTIPANTEATIDVVRSADQRALGAASGIKTKRTPVVSLKSAGASATSKTPKTGNENMDIKKQLEAAEAKRAANAARMQAILKAASEDGERTLNEPEGEEFDGLEAENEALDVQIKRLNTAMKAASETAARAGVPVNGATQEGAAAARAGVVTSVRSNLPKGAGFTRMVQALAATKGNLGEARHFAETNFNDSPEVATVLRAAVAAGTTSDPAWGGNLVEYKTMAGEFIELIRAQTVVDKLTWVRRVPFRVKVPTQTAGSTAGWVGEAAPKPVSSLAFGSVQLDEHKVAGIIVISQELARSSSPAALDIIQRDLVAAVSQQIDLSFLNPANAGSLGVSPASVLNGVAGIPASGTNAAAVRNDVQALFNSYLGVNQTVTGLTFVMSPSTALALSLMLNPLGQPEFPGLSAQGGTFFGLPVVLSNNVPTDSSGSIIALINQADILMADDGNVTVDVSTQASVQMNTTPDNPATASTVMTSFFQNNMIGVRAERFITWKRGRDSAVAYLTGVNYQAG